MLYINSSQEKQSGFTLLETAITLLLMAIVINLGFSFIIFNKDFFYLRDSAKNFSFALNTVSDMSQKVIQKNNEYFCAYGIYFPNNSSYEVLAFSTTTKLCEIIFSSTSSVNNFFSQNVTNKKYILQNQQIVSPSQIIPSLSMNFQFKPGYRFRFSTSDKNCATDTLTPPLIFLYAYSYADLFLVYQQVGGWNVISSNQVYICLEKLLGSSVTEKYTIKINKLGQINFEK